MSNETPNNAPRWRNKLDKLEHLPGSSFHGDVAWDKLYGRLKGNRKNKRIFWYWTAAACLIVGLMATFLNQRKTISQPEHPETAITQPKKADIPVMGTDEANKNKNENRIEFTKGKIINSPDKPFQRNRRIIPTQVSTKVQSNEPVIDDAEQDHVAKPVQIVGNSTAAVVPPKKKLKVVHINELGDPIMETSDITRIADMHAFQLKFGHGEVLSNSPIASKSSGLIILKTKPPSN